MLSPSPHPFSVPHLGHHLSLVLQGRVLVALGFRLQNAHTAPWMFWSSPSGSITPFAPLVPRPSDWTEQCQQLPRDSRSRRTNHRTSQLPQPPEPTASHIAISELVLYLTVSSWLVSWRVLTETSCHVKVSSCCPPLPQRVLKETEKEALVSLLPVPVGSPTSSGVVKSLAVWCIVREECRVRPFTTTSGTKAASHLHTVSGGHVGNSHRVPLLYHAG